MSIEDAYTRRQILLTGLANQTQRDVFKPLQDMLDKIEERMLAGPTDFQEVRLKKLREDISFYMNEGFSEYTETLSESIEKAADVEAGFATRAIQQGTNVILATPSPHVVMASVLNTALEAPMGPQQIFLSEAYEQFATGRKADITRLINDAILFGDTTDQAAAKLRDMVESRTKAQSHALVRTAINHTTSQARKSVARENSDILQGEEWVATLDSRTTDLCAGRDGNIYPVGGGPYPPAHWNCRSIRVPKIKDEYAIEDETARRPAVGPKGGTTVSGRTKFDGWLRGQPASFQDEYFSQFPDGKLRSKLFRQGKLPIQAFRDETGRTYTIEQLQALEPLAFEKANIDLGQ